MEYTEINRTEQKTIFTEVIITFDCGCSKNVSIAHFMPNSEDDIQLGISNRMISEQNVHVCEMEVTPIIEENNL